MSEHSVTLALPDDIYQQAQRVAETTQQEIEEVVLAWIHPTPEEELVELDELSNDELLTVAQSIVPLAHAERLQDLLVSQRQRSLTENEQRAEKLVEQEDLLTLRKSKALLLLKQRGALTKDLHTFGVYV